MLGIVERNPIIRVVFIHGVVYVFVNETFNCFDPSALCTVCGLLTLVYVFRPEEGWSTKSFIHRLQNFSGHS